MYIVKKNTNKEHISSELSLRKLLTEFLEDESNDITIRPLSEQLGLSENRLKKYLAGDADINMGHAVRIMELFDLSENELIAAYNNDMDNSDIDQYNKTKEISYVYRHFDIQTLKKIGILKKSRIEEYAQQLCDFFGFNSIYEYDSIELGMSLFSKSYKQVSANKEKKMVEFWLKCSCRSFLKISNPFEYDRELLIEFLKRISQYTADVVHGLEKIVLILFRLGVTVLIHEYVPNTTSFGVSMIVNGKPCIVITDMNKQYHKLWLNLLHELYHILYDWDMLEKVNYHISDKNNPELIFSEERADDFSYNALINPAIQNELHKIIPMRFKVHSLASSLSIDPSIIYGVYLERLPNGLKKNREYAKYNNPACLKSSDIAITKISFDPVTRRSLIDSISKMQESVQKISI